MSQFVQIQLTIPNWLAACLVQQPSALLPAGLGEAGDWRLSLAAEGVLNRHVATARPAVPVPQPVDGRPLTLHVPKECADGLRGGDRAAALGDLALGVLLEHSGMIGPHAADRAMPAPCLPETCRHLAI